MRRIRSIRSFPVLMLIGAMTCWSSLVSADPITVDFEITGFGDSAKLTGWFTGDDDNGVVDGVLGHSVALNLSDLTDFQINWSGNSRVSAFTHGLADLRSLTYNIATNTLSFLRSTSGGGLFNSPSATLRPGFWGAVSSVRDGWKSASSHRPGVTTTVKVSEPGTLALLGLGLLGLGLARRKTA